MKRMCRNIIVFCMGILAAALLPVNAHAQEEQALPVLRVAFPEAAGYTETDEYGVRHGVVVDYLNEISKYTGWQYEYIETDQEKLIDDFLAGKFDLMGGAFYQKELEEYFAYPEYNCGHGKSILMARRDDGSIKVYDWRSMSGKTIGVYENAKENIRRLEEFLAANAIDCTLKQYSYQEFVDGNLYAYLENGEVDMLLGNNADKAEEFRIVAEFDSQPQYIVTTVGNQEVLDGLNMAMKKIIESNPNFAEECFSANFPDSGMQSILLNDEEEDYIREKQTVKVAVVRKWHPLYCMETKNDFHNGIIPDILQAVEEFSGLQFAYVFADNYESAVNLVETGEADMLGAFLGTEEESARMNLALTAPYAALNDIVARNKSVSFPAEGLVGAVIDGREIPLSIKAEQVVYYSNMTEALRAVNRGEADFFYGLAPQIEKIIQEHHYANVIPNTLVNENNTVSFAVMRPARDELLQIMNKAISGMSSADKINTSNQNMISAGSSQFTVIDFIYANPVMVVSILVGIFWLVVIFVLLAAYSRVRAAKMQNSLEKAEAESRAKGEFLSRMSHEIRTPMNAIVGLSDLTCMLEEVPDNVRENLVKIRSSSHYLLSLISDILDMSRIDSGMLNIGKEPFLIGQVLTDLRSMMTAEAERLGVEFHMEETARRETLLGDEVRLKQVLTNLISNALKFTPAGGKVTVTVRETGRGENTVRYHFRVSDNGIGISEENQKRIFEAFEQVGSNYTKSQGTGLGLAISRNIVALMGGELKLTSEKGTGSEFYFGVEFPVDAADRITEKNGGETESDCDLSGMLILLAEDNDLNAEIAEELLRIRGASVRRAKNGLEAVQMFQASRHGEFQAILMDIQMPLMNGLLACKAIRGQERPDAAAIPIIAMTANSFKEDSDAAIAAGMNGFVTKPVDVKYLYGALQKAMAKET